MGVDKTYGKTVFSCRRNIDNVEKALEQLKPYAIDVSSGIETEGRKDKRKMAAIMTAVRKERKL